MFERRASNFIYVGPQQVKVQTLQSVLGKKTILSKYMYCLYSETNSIQNQTGKKETSVPQASLINRFKYV